jgi:hypothetical protein
VLSGSHKGQPLLDDGTNILFELFKSADEQSVYALTTNACLLQAL